MPNKAKREDAARGQRERKSLRTGSKTLLQHRVSGAVCMRSATVITHRNAAEALAAANGCRRLLGHQLGHLVIVDGRHDRPAEIDDLELDLASSGQGKVS